MQPPASSWLHFPEPKHRWVMNPRSIFSRPHKSWLKSLGMPWDLCLLDACGRQKEQGSENEEGKFQPMEQLAWNGKLTVRYYWEMILPQRKIKSLSRSIEQQSPMQNSLIPGTNIFFFTWHETFLGREETPIMFLLWLRGALMWPPSKENKQRLSTKEALQSLAAMLITSTRGDWTEPGLCLCP